MAEGKEMGGELKGDLRQLPQQDGKNGKNPGRPKKVTPANSPVNSPAANLQKKAAKAASSRSGSPLLSSPSSSGSRTTRSSSDSGSNTSVNLSTPVANTVVDKPDTPVETGVQPSTHDAEIDVITNGEINKPIASPKESLDFCPCSKSSGGTAWKLECTKCKQTWHNTCVNLRGITKEFVKSLTDWLCPDCFSPPTICVNCKKRGPPSKLDARLKCLTQKLDTLSQELSEMKENAARAPENILTVRDLELHLNQLNTAAEMQANEITVSLNVLKDLVTQTREVTPPPPATCPSAPSTLPPQPAAPSPPELRPPYQALDRDFLQGELLESLEKLVNTSQGFTEAPGAARKLLYYGEYDYSYGPVKHKAQPLPAPLMSCIQLIKDLHPSLSTPNSCLISVYDEGSKTCPPHRDDELFIDPASNIYTLSLGATRTMQFTSASGDPVDLPLPGNSLAVFSRLSQEQWKHAIVPDQSVTQRRYSLTFRTIAPHFINGTIILGDSHTKHLKFGEGKGNLGIWLPGERIAGNRIHLLPTPDKLLPYRNLVIHVGVNDIKQPDRESTHKLIGLLDEKCLAIATAFPKMRIHLSLILPTRDPNLNDKANEFNEQLHKLVNSRPYLHKTIRHDTLCDRFGFLRSSYARDARPQDPSDPIHLSTRGTGQFVSNIKSVVIFKKPGSSKRPDTVPGHHPGDRPPRSDRYPSAHPERYPLPHHPYPYPPWHQRYPPFPADRFSARTQSPHPLPPPDPARPFASNYRDALEGRRSQSSDFPLTRNDGYQ